MKYLFALLIVLHVLPGCVGATPNIPVNLKNVADERILSKCLPVPEMSKALFDGFRETIKASAILHAAPKKMLVLFYASDSGSFTVTLTGQNQVSCAILWGSNYSIEKDRNSIKI
jgi:hypothetical protein